MFIGVTFISSPSIKDYLVSSATNRNLDKVNLNQIKQNQNKKVSYEFKDVNFITIKDVTRAKNKSLPIIGEIKIPSVNLHLPIIKGVSNDSMSAGAGTLKENQQMGFGNYSLASHHMRNSKLLFSPLDRVEIGNKIYLSDGEQEFVYEVISKEVVEENRIDVIEEKQGQTLVTLVTCNARGTKRLIVTGELIRVGQKAKKSEIGDLRAGLVD